MYIISKFTQLVYMCYMQGVAGLVTSKAEMHTESLVNVSLHFSQTRFSLN